MRKSLNIITLLVFVLTNFLSLFVYAQNNTESNGITIIRSDGVDLVDRETGVSYATIREVFLDSGDDEYTDLSQISTSEVCGEGYHLITADEMSGLGENFPYATDDICGYHRMGYYGWGGSGPYIDSLDMDEYGKKGYGLFYNNVLHGDNNLFSLDSLFKSKFSIFVYLENIDVECIKHLIEESNYEYNEHLAIPTSECSADFGIYYNPDTNTFSKFSVSIETDPETGDSFSVRHENDISTLTKNEPLLCISEEIPQSKSEITFINEENGFEYQTTVLRGEKLSQSDIDYITQNNQGYMWYWGVKRIDFENQLFKYDSKLYAYKPIDQKNITYKGPYNIEDRKNNKIIATIKLLSLDVDEGFHILNLHSTDNICGTGFHLFYSSREGFEASFPGHDIPQLKMDLYLDNVNNYPQKLLGYFPNYAYALGFFVLAFFPENFRSTFLQNNLWNYFKLAEPTSSNSVNTFNYFNDFVNLLMTTSLSFEMDYYFPPYDYVLVVGEEYFGDNVTFTRGTEFLCVSNMLREFLDGEYTYEEPIYPEVVLINEDNGFEYRVRASEGGKLSQKDLDYINKENPNYIWYVADVLDIDLENDIFEYNTVLFARKPVEILDMKNDEIIKLKSIQNSPYFADDYDEYEDEAVWFYDNRDEGELCGESWYAVTGDDLSDLINLGNLGEDGYNRWGDNTLTYCASNPEVIVTLKNEEKNSEYEIYVEKGKTMKSRDINKIIKYNTGYEWYNGDNLVDLSSTVFNERTELHAVKIPENNGKLNYSGGGGGSLKVTNPDNEKTDKDDSKVDTEEKSSLTPLNNGGDPELAPLAEDGGIFLAERELEHSRGQTYTQEFQQAYKFAKESGITTMPTIQEAKMDGKLTRIEMAKMLSQYAINVLGKVPDTTKNIKFRDVSDKRNKEYDNGVTLAYQLGIMGQNMPKNRFRPNDEVSRAEFVTALSRMLYNTTDGEYEKTSKYYISHMAKLYNEGIINQTNPKMKELRGYVMIMLMRSAK